MKKLFAADAMTGEIIDETVTVSKTSLDQLTQDLATAKGQIEMLKESNENWMDGFKAKERDLADSDKDLATAQAEIARLRNLLWLAKDKLEIFRKHSDGQYQGGIEYTQLWNMLDEALSQSSPSLALQEYRDKVIDECANAVTCNGAGERVFETIIATSIRELKSTNTKG